MNLLNEKITHETFGTGNVVEQDENIITVDFEDGNRKFVYPDAFGKFISLKDEDTAKSLKKVISKIEEEKVEREREEEREQQALARIRQSQAGNRAKRPHIHENAIVFWLDEEEQENVFADWEVSTGTVQSGKNKGQPNRPARLRPNSACLLTERASDIEEKERRILGLYMLTETFSGDVGAHGLVPAHAEYRIELTDEEAENMLFWNYYINKSYPDRMTWNSGKFRYFENIWIAQILKDIIAMKEDEEEIKEAENFLEYYCNLNALDVDDIPEKSGALKQ
ncbi:malate synthase [Virgibacillus sp. MSJ-26]|uniref:malate synthase n=1 Tax=Virgibacillus sp. MSJ-26 TaxID=2841522 RepID=UPI001C1076FE|nr:malate synthase [Virgibacillus sp. MSJ-26]MBU5468312.1 malate synthase [Virgibacillus sp. MSJ-26]